MQVFGIIYTKERITGQVVVNSWYLGQSICTEFQRLKQRSMENFMDRRLNHILALSLTMFLLTSCSSFISKMAVNSTGAVLSQASDEVLSEGNWDVFFYGVPGNLKLMEGLHFIDPEDRNVLSSLIKGYAGYAFVVNETLALDEEYRELEMKPNHLQAIYNYSKAVRYGEMFLKTYGLSYEGLLKAANDPKKAKNYLSKIGSDKFERHTLFFIAQAYGGLILFNRDDMAMISKRPLVKSIFDYVCEIEPGINGGACDIFYAANLALTPAMMGGDPYKGQELFIKALKKYPENYFIRIAYLQFFAIPFEEEEIFNENLEFFKKKEKEFRAKLEFNPNQKDNLNNKNMRLFQSLAFKRLQIIKTHKNNFF